MQKTIAVYIKALHRRFDQFCDRQLQEMGLTKGLLYVVLYVGNHPGCGPGELAEALGFDAGHATRSMEKLVKAGLVAKERSREDRRAVCLRLTEAGREAFEASRGLFQEWDETAAGELTEEERTELIRLLGKMTGEKGRNGHDL